MAQSKLLSTIDDTICFIDTLHNVTMDIDYDKTGIVIEEFEERCILLRNLLSIGEQIELFGELEEEEQESSTKLEKHLGSKYDKDKIRKDGTASMFTRQNISGDLLTEYCADSIYSKIIQKAINSLQSNYKLKCMNLDERKLGHIQALKYISPNGNFKNHVDKFFGDNIVLLFSLGCTANFYLNTPKMKNEQIFKFQSGDMLCFDANSSAKIMHGILNIDDKSSSPQPLQSKYPNASKYRIGFQLRMF